MEIGFVFTPYTDPQFGLKIQFRTSYLPIGRAQTEGGPPAEFPNIPSNEVTMAAIPAILEQTIINPDAGYFLRPVDPKVDQAATYLDEIKNPIDLGQMHRRANNGNYSNFKELTDDMQLLISNATKYNNSNHPVYRAAINLSYFFRDLLIRLERDPQGVAASRALHQAEARIGNELLRFQKRKADIERMENEQTKIKQPPKPAKKVTQEEIEDLVQDIKGLSTSALIGVIEIITKKPFSPSMLPFYRDISILDPGIVEDLRTYVQSVKREDIQVPVYYAWRPPLPQRLAELRASYESELLTWKSAPPDSIF